MTTTKIQTSPWNSADFLKTEEDVEGYFEACLQEASDDPAFIAHALGMIARARGMPQVARDSGMNCEELDSCLSKNGNPSFGTVLRVIRALGLQFHVSRISA